MIQIKRNLTFAHLMTMLTRTSVIALLFFALASCSPYQKVLNGDDFDAKFAYANELYEKEQYAKAIPLYEELKRVFLGKDKMRVILINLANCEYQSEQLYLASYHFKQYFEAYPLSGQAEDALFMHCKCQHRLSPKSTLDQQSTQKAISAFEKFVVTFPESDKVKECNRMIDELSVKIEEKSFTAARLYHGIGDYKAAVWALNNFIRDNPGTIFREEAEFLVVESAYMLAKNSVQKKQEERYVETVEYFKTFKSRYPDSKYLNKAKSYVVSSQVVLNSFKTDKTN